jgi:hypothetical protein
MTLNQEITLFCAFRYALGRKTYVVGAVCEELQRHYNELKEHDKAKYVQEIQEYQDEWGVAGDEFDNIWWNKIKWLFDSNRKRTISVNYYGTDRWETVEAVFGGDGKYYSIPDMREYHTVKIVE